VSALVVKWRTDEGGVVTAILLGRGRKYLRLIPIDSAGIKLTNVSFDEERHMVPAEFKGKPYPVKRAARSILKFGKTFGITKTAKAALKETLT
jgi:hypothetical protein